MILLDVVMPGMDGYQVCETLKAGESTQQIPVVFVSANNSEEEKARGLLLGAAGFLGKPVDPGQLALLLRDVFAKEDQ